ncbi:MAG: hypothetical protein LBQ60_00990 [Bacteroidales bacterium]|nr:hypothetical protein [Bacteroidales bacterium]
MKKTYLFQNKTNTEQSLIVIGIIFLLSLFPNTSQAKNRAFNDKYVSHDHIAKTIKIQGPDQKLGILIDYSDGCRITHLTIKDKNTLSSSGIYTGFRTKGGSYTSDKTENEVKIEETSGKIVVREITYGDAALKVNETWTFDLNEDKIRWHIDRRYSTLAKLEETAFPQWSFDRSIWKGGIMDNGGMVWCKYLSSVNDTYGVHTGGVTFWNPDSGDALRIEVKSDEGKYLAAKYSQNEKNEFTCTHFVTDMELEPRYNLSRFVHQKSDVFCPFDVQKENISIHIEIQYINYLTEYSRGILPGIDADAVRELLNTTGRYGVVDNTIVGANGWITNWKCLHEPFFAQIGMALNDENYIKNMSSTLDAERDHAMTEEGRVRSRWHNMDEDQMPGTFNYKTGYYEAQWGYTIDSQTGYIINTAEQFDLCGDIDWLSAHKESCEKALDWLIKRDSNKNGIFEMMNDDTSQKIASDWLDIVWASFENAFVNAQMYEALNLWANCESILGDKTKSDYYFSVAARLKESFNKPVSQGGFWAPDKKQYIYWRDKDGSVHGDNFVTPVNFAVIAFGLCDDEKRIKIILDEIEKRTSAENLFHWPLCFDSYREEEVASWQWPFPTYENGDIFPTWGYLGIRSYVGYKKEIALKYIRNILQQYKKDGLSSQRYSRITQEGLGSDILAGICTSITALYRDIYGIRPRWNRMGLEPNMLKELNGTEFTYSLRGTDYHLKLNVNDYMMSTDGFKIKV